MNKFNPEAIVCADFSIDVVLFDGDLTPEECSYVFMKAVQEDYPIPMLNDVIILGTKEYYDENGIDVIYVHPSEDDFWEVMTHNNIMRALRTRSMEIKFFDAPKREDVQMSNEGYLLQAYSYDSLDAYEEYMKGAKYFDPIVRENGLVAPPTHIDDDIEDIPF